MYVLIILPAYFGIHLKIVLSVVIGYYSLMFGLRFNPSFTLVKFISCAQFLKCHRRDFIVTCTGIVHSIRRKIYSCRLPVIYEHQ